MESSAIAAELGRLRWRSRRGMRELDRLFERYLDRCWLSANAEERAAFERLLGCEDPLLWQWFMGQEAPQDAALAAIVERIRAA